jgi:hypothetical protein
MAAEKQSDQRSGPERERARDLRPPTPPSPQPGPPNFSDGPETPRSSHC